MTPGIYKAEWGPGHQLVGKGVVVFMNTVIAGADVFDAVFDGEYAFNGDGKLDVRWLRFHIPAGVAMAQGIPPLPKKYTLDIQPFTLDMNDDGPTLFVIPTTPMPLNVRLTRLRRLEP